MKLLINYFINLRSFNKIPLLSNSYTEYKAQIKCKKYKIELNTFKHYLHQHFCLVSEISIK